MSDNKIERWDLQTTGPYRDPLGNMIPEPEGDYVRYEDYVNSVEPLMNEIVKLRRLVAEAKKLMKKGSFPAISRDGGTEFPSVGVYRWQCETMEIK